MNIFCKVALQGLLKNRTRSLVTIAGVMLSAALFTGVATFAVSLQQYMVRGSAQRYGSWHLQFFERDAAFIQEISEADGVAETAVLDEAGYALLEGGQNPDKPYLFIAGLQEGSFSPLSLRLIDGRMPENSSEVLVPAHVQTNGGVCLQTGETLTLAVGERRKDGQPLSQLNPLQDGEMLFPTEKRSYTVVGTCQRPAFELRTAPGYTLITLPDPTAPAGSFTVFVTLQDPLRARSFAERWAGKGGYALNDNVLRFLGISDNKAVSALFFSAGAVLFFLITLGSVFMIYNSFHISLGERTHQLGILMSVGATGKQLRGSVLFEGLCIGAVGIPLGLFMGIPAIRLVLKLVEKAFSNILYAGIPLDMAVSAPFLALSAAISLITLLVSAYIPARKAAGTPVMDCIRQTREIRLDAKKLHIPALLSRFCGLPEILALKNFRRNRGRSRSILLSLSFSVVIFVTASYFKVCLTQISDQMKVVTDYDVALGFQQIETNRLAELFDRLKTAQGVTDGSCRIAMECTASMRKDLLSAPCRQASGVQVEGETAQVTVSVLILSDEFYCRFVESLGLPAQEYAGPDGKRIAVAKMEAAGYAEGPDDLEDLFAAPTLKLTLYPQNGSGQSQGTGIAVQADIRSFVPPDAPPLQGSFTDLPYYFGLLVPWSAKDAFLFDGVRILGKGMGFCSENPGQTASAMREMLAGIGETAGFTLLNMHEALEQFRNILFVVDLFTCVFVSMISLIALANVFNTISTNIHQRRRELAMLRSAGMADREFGRMMRFECALYGLRTLLFGLPVSLLLCWLIHAEMTYRETEPIPFLFPWSSLFLSILGVSLAVFITTLYAAGKLQRENIIDALRDELA